MCFEKDHDVEDGEGREGKGRDRKKDVTGEDGEGEMFAGNSLLVGGCHSRYKVPISVWAA
jgi:hypothetical protein